MKYIIPFVAIFFTSTGKGQDLYEKLRKNRSSADYLRIDEIYKQVDQIIFYSPKLLGKTEYQLYSQGKPVELSGDLFPWQATWLTPPSGEKKLHIRQKHDVATTIILSSTGYRSFAIRFNPNFWLSIDEFHNYLKGKYGIRNDGFSEPINTDNNQTAVFKFTIEDNFPIIYIYNIDHAGNFLYYK